MKLFFEITEVDALSARHEGAGTHGLHLDRGADIAWEMPMLGTTRTTSGSSPDPATLQPLLAAYAQAPDLLRPEDGPDEILFASGWQFYLLTITLE